MCIGLCVSICKVYYQLQLYVLLHELVPKIEIWLWWHFMNNINESTAWCKQKSIFFVVVKICITLWWIDKISNFLFVKMLMYIYRWIFSRWIFSLEVVTFFVTLRAELEDYFKYKTQTGDTLRKLTSGAFWKCGSFWVLTVLNQSYWLSKLGENWRKSSMERRR